MARLTVASRVMLVGWHSWPSAPDHRAYLRSLHRHVFHLEAEVEVTDPDREVEFHDLAQTIRDWWGWQEIMRDRGSCESMAVELAGKLASDYDVIEVSVGEDGESVARYRP